MITCKEFDNRMPDFLEEDLGPWQGFSFWLHMKLCSNCRKHLAGYQQAIALSKAAWQSLDDHQEPVLAENMIKTVPVNADRTGSTDQRRSLRDFALAPYEKPPAPKTIKPDQSAQRAKPH